MNTQVHAYACTHNYTLSCMIFSYIITACIHTHTYMHVHTHYTVHRMIFGLFTLPHPECSEGCPVVRDTRPLPTHRAVHTDHCSGQELQTSVSHSVRTEVLQWSQGESGLHVRTCMSFISG